MSDRVFINHMTIRYLLAMGLLAVHALAGYWLLQEKVQTQGTYAATINISGRQRMLSQRLVLLARYLTSTRDQAERAETRKDLVAAVGLMEKSHKGLIGIDPAGQLSPPSPPVRAIYFDSPILLDSQVRAYLAEARALIETPDAQLSQDNPHLQSLVTASTHLLAALDLVVKQYQKDSEEALTRLENLQGGVFGTALLALVLIGVLIFRPMVRRVRQQQQALITLNATLEQQVAERTAAAEKRAQELARSQETLSKLSGAIEQTADVVFITNKKGVIEYVNPAFEQLTGYTGEEVFGKTPAILKSGKYDKKYYESLWKTILSGRPYRGTVINRKKSGELYYEQKTITPLKDRQGNITHFVSTGKDVTEQRQAEEALREINRRLEETLTELKQTQKQIIQQERLRALGQIASGIAHDFNNALTPVLGYTQLLLLDPDSLDDREQLVAYLKLIQTGAQDAANVVNRLREFYRQREETEVYGPVDLNALVEQSVQLTQPKWKAQALATGITISIETDLQQVPAVAGNEAELREVLINLIFNAVDAMPEGGTLTLRTRHAGEWGVVEVQDTGTGMSEEVRRRCLEPFFSTKGERGTGLGLAIVYGIIQRHEGTIHIESEPGQGTTFTIHLPVQTAPLPEVSRQKSDTPLRSLQILVVEDETPVREVVVRFLTADGHKVETATNGREGLEKFSRGWCDLVITDKAMPGMSGEQLAAAIKQVAPRKPVILLTGFGELIKASGEKPAGVDAVVSKPLQLSELREALVKVSSLPPPAR